MKNIFKYILCGVMWLAIGQAQAQNNPYVDDKLVHFGFFLGLDMLSYNIQENDSLTQAELLQTDDQPNNDTDIYHPRVSAIGVGFRVGGIVDLRLNRFLNLRFTPSLQPFGVRTINYLHTSNDTTVTAQTSVPTVPVSIPIHLKWSAERIKNYRPYVIVGGGVEIECYSNKQNQMVLHKRFDAFVSAGFGCDFYFRWFKFCPEIKYQIGFLDAHTPISADAAENGWGISASNYFYTHSIKRMTHQKLSIVFNFE